MSRTTTQVITRSFGHWPQTKIAFKLLLMWLTLCTNAIPSLIIVYCFVILEVNAGKFTPIPRTPSQTHGPPGCTLTSNSLEFVYVGVVLYEKLVKSKKIIFHPVGPLIPRWGSAMAKIDFLNADTFSRCDLIWVA